MSTQGVRQDLLQASQTTVPRSEIVDKADPLVVVGIPAYNEEKSIAIIVLKAKNYAREVVVCDDGSSDMTGEIAENLGAVVVRHHENLGYGSAIQSLFAKAKELKADVLVTLDGDGQHCPDDISGLLAPILRREADIVAGSRFVGNVGKGANHVPWYRRLGIKTITKLTMSTSKCRISDAQNGFRAYSRVALEKLLLTESGMGISVEILVKARELGLRLTEAPAACNYSRVERPSTQNPLRHGIGVVMSLVRLVVEKRPLVLLGVPGAASLLLGFLFGVWMLQLYAIEHRIVTNLALASIGFAMLGIFAIFTAITLYAIARLAKKVNQQYSP